MSASSNAINKETFEELQGKLNKKLNDMGFKVNGINKVNDVNYLGSFKVSKNCEETHAAKNHRPWGQEHHPLEMDCPR